LARTAIKTTKRPAPTPAPTKPPAKGGPRVAVVIPCYNEEVAIGQTIADFRAALPQAEIYVYDNNSSDGTVAVARKAGAIVRSERIQGKGAVVRRMFADVEADIYVMTDGDATYDASAAPGMVEKMLAENMDMVVGARESEVQEAYRRGHRFGNQLLTGCVTYLFGRTFSDILSGYRVFSRRFAKTFPTLSPGFEIETEITVHALELKMPVGEVVTAYAARPEGSVSKLSTYRDGWRILRLIMELFRQERPVQLYGGIAGVLSVLAILLAIPLVITYLHTGLVPRIPTAVLCTGLILLAVFSAMCGLILDTVTRGRREMKRLAYISMPPPTVGRGG
jgi:glycosyltransferase involved in cell wall biosynthesis